MAKVEIEESELQNLQRVANVATVIGKHPKARALLQEAVSLAAPEEAGPEVRLRNEFTEALNGFGEKLNAFIEGQTKKEEETAAERSKRSLERQWSAGRSKAREANYTDEGIEKLEAWMVQKGVADHEIAMAAFERENPPPAPVATGGASWNFFDQRDNPESGLDLLLKGDDEAFLQRQINTALKDVRGQR
jgi:hypothetical protein